MQGKAPLAYSIEYSDGRIIDWAGRACFGDIKSVSTFTKNGLSNTEQKLLFDAVKGRLVANNSHCLNALSPDNFHYVVQLTDVRKMFPQIYPKEIILHTVDVRNDNDMAHLQAIINKFPYIISKSAEEAIEDGLRVSARGPVTNVMQSLQLVREMWESRSLVCSQWQSLKGAGCSDDIAILFARYNFRYRVFHESHHGSTPRDIPIQSVANYLLSKKAPRDKGQLPFNHSPKYYIQRYWTNIGSQTVRCDLKKLDINDRQLDFGGPTQVYRFEQQLMEVASG